MVRRTGAVDRGQGIFGYFFGGGWAFGQVENDNFTYTADSVQRYIDASDSGYSSFLLEYWADDREGVQIGVIDLDAGEAIPDGGYYLVQQVMIHSDF
jgi:hypothetical protein